MLAEPDPVAAFLAAHEAGDPVALATSGTSSGAPRWVVRSTGSWVTSFPAYSRLAEVGAGSRVWLPGPLEATMNLFAAVHAAAVGARVVAAVEDATHAALTPSALARALDDGAPLGGRMLVVAGDRLSPGLHDRAVAAGARLRHYYGAAELSFVAWGRHARDLRAFPGVQVEARDGEVWARSPYLCTGYDGSPGPLRWDRHGFATVGDRGRLGQDPDGTGALLLVRGRPGTLAVGGSTVEVAGIESVLAGAATGEVVVVGVPHPVLGEVPAAVLTRAEDVAPVRRLARAELTGPRRPRVWYLLERLPLTPAGKPDRAAVEQAVAGPDARRLV